MPACCVLLAGGLLSLVMFAAARYWQWERTTARFEREAEQRVACILRSLEPNLVLVEAVGAYFESDERVSRKEFSDFVALSLRQLPSIQAVEWIPRVADSQRAAYEDAARTDGLADFQITDRLAQGRMAPAPRREEYFPVYFIEPYKGNEIALGFDLASNPVRRRR